MHSITVNMRMISGKYEEVGLELMSIDPHYRSKEHRYISNLASFGPDEWHTLVKLTFTVTDEDVVALKLKHNDTQHWTIVKL